MGLDSSGSSDAFIVFCSVDSSSSPSFTPEEEELDLMYEFAATGAQNVDGNLIAEREVVLDGEVRTVQIRYLGPQMGVELKCFKVDTEHPGNNCGELHYFDPKGGFTSALDKQKVIMDAFLCGM